MSGKFLNILTRAEFLFIIENQMQKTQSKTLL